MTATDLASCLRSWRDRVTPQDVGLPAQARRRAPGLRREELALLAGVSAGYLTRLEQGRAAHPSPSVLGALARALRLSDEEQELLFALAGQGRPAAAGRMRRHLTSGVQHMLDRLEDVPVLVLDAAWDVVAANALGAALHGDHSARRGRERNVVWQHFAGAETRVVHTDEQRVAFETQAVGELHAALARFPADPVLRERIEELLAASPRFAELWETRPAAVHASLLKTFEHPEAGRLSLDCDVLSVQGSDLRLVIHTPRPGSPDAETLRLIGVLGLQRFGVA